MAGSLVGGVRKRLYELIPKPSPIMADNGGVQEVSGVLILINGENPTFSYYFEERLRLINNVPVIVRTLTERLEDIHPHGLFVIVCRYIKSRHIEWIRQTRSSLAGVAFFVDDDMASIVASRDGSLRYKLNLLRLGILPLKKLNPLLSEVWVSTHALAESLPSRSCVKILPPFPPPLLPKEPTHAANDVPLRIAYHATGIHRREHEFLHPVMRKVLEANIQLSFEVLADGHIASSWRQSNLPPHQLVIKGTMKWRDYVANAARNGADIALVPLMKSRTNASRSDTKRVDVARLGAAAIYSKCDIFDRCAVPGEIHVSNNIEDWVSAILRLAADREALDAAKRAAFISLEKMTRLADPSFPFSPRLVSGA